MTNDGQFMHHPNASILPDSPLEMRERAMQEAVDRLIEFLEACQRGSMPDAFYFVSLHQEDTSDEGIQELSVGTPGQLMRVLTQAQFTTMQQLWADRVRQMRPPDA